MAQKCFELAKSQEEARQMEIKCTESEKQRELLEKELSSTQEQLSDVKKQLGSIMAIRFDVEQVQEALRLVFKDEMKSFSAEMMTLMGSMTSQFQFAPPYFTQVRPMVQSE